MLGSDGAGQLVDDGTDGMALKKLIGGTGERTAAPRRGHCPEEFCDPCCVAWGSSHAACLNDQPCGGAVRQYPAKRQAHAEGIDETVGNDAGVDRRPAKHRAEKISLPTVVKLAIQAACGIDGQHLPDRAPGCAQLNLGSSFAEDRHFDIA
jgi:hypothetical protein